MAEAIPVLPLPGMPAPAAPVAPATPKAPEAPKPIDPMIALLAKERAHAAERQKFATEREAFAKEKSEADKARTWRESLLKNPAALEEVYGPDWYDKLTEFRLNGGKATPELVAQSVEAKLTEWEKRQDDRAAAERKRIVEEQNALVEQFRSDTTEWVRGQPEYELIQLHGMQGEVVRLIENHFKQTQKILTGKEAADLLEADLVERVEKSLKTKRFAAKVAPEKRPESAQPRTLTNALTAVSGPPTSQELDMSDDARLTRAIAKGEAVRRARMGG